MAVVRSFHRHRGESAFTMARLIEVLKEQIPLAAPHQSRYRVAVLPTERTIRFYTARGIVDKPAGHQGASALYGYRHLLQILAVKSLQAQYLPLAKIKSLVEDADNRDLETMIPESQHGGASPRGIARDERRLISGFPPAAGTAVAGDVPGAVQATAWGEHAPDTWHRIEVCPGIELNVHTSALTGEHRERLRGALLREIGLLRGWRGAPPGP